MKPPITVCSLPVNRTLHVQEKCIENGLYTFLADNHNDD